MKLINILLEKLTTLKLAVAHGKTLAHDEYIHSIFGALINNNLIVFINAYEQTSPTEKTVCLDSFEHLITKICHTLLSEPIAQKIDEVRSGQPFIAGHVQQVESLYNWVQILINWISTGEPQDRIIRSINDKVQDYGGADKLADNRIPNPHRRAYYAESLGHIVDLIHHVFNLYHNVSQFNPVQFEARYHFNKFSRALDVTEQLVRSQSPILEQPDSFEHRTFARKSKLINRDRESAVRSLMTQSFIIGALYQINFEPPQESMTYQSLLEAREPDQGGDEYSIILSHNQFPPALRHYITSWDQLGVYLKSLAQAVDEVELRKRTSALLQNIFIWKEQLEFWKIQCYPAQDKLFRKNISLWQANLEAQIGRPDIGVWGTLRVLLPIYVPVISYRQLFDHINRLISEHPVSDRRGKFYHSPQNITFVYTHLSALLDFEKNLSTVKYIVELVIPSKQYLDSSQVILSLVAVTGRKSIVNESHLGSIKQIMRPLSSDGHSAIPLLREGPAPGL